MEKKLGKSLAQLELLICGGLILAFAVLLLIVARDVFFSDSEIWAVALAKKIGGGKIEYSVLYKFLFYILLRLTYLVPTQDSLSVILAGRYLFWANAMLLGWFCYLLSWKLWKNQIVALASVLFLFGSSAFLHSGVRIRSDLVVATSILGLLVWSQNILEKIAQGKPKKLVQKEIVWLWFTAFLPFFFTPKAIIFQVPLFIYLWQLFHAQIRAILRERSKIFLVLAANLLLSVLFYGAKTSYDAAFSFLQEGIRSYSDEGLVKYVLSPIRWRFFLFFAAKDVILWGSFILSLVYVWIERKRFPRAVPIAWYVIVLLTIGLLHPSLYPFYIASLMSVVVVIAPAALNTFRIPFLTLVCLILYLHGSILYYGDLLSTANNSDQRNHLVSLENYIQKNAPRTYYDVIGLLPRRNQHFFFAGEYQKFANLDAMKRVEEARPEIIIYPYRGLHLEPFFTRFLMDSYLEVYPGFWISAQPISELSYRLKKRASSEIEISVADIRKKYPELSGELYFYAVDAHRNVVSSMQVRGDIIKSQWRKGDTWFISRFPPYQGPSVSSFILLFSPERYFRITQPDSLG